MLASLQNALGSILFAQDTEESFFQSWWFFGICIGAILALIGVFVFMRMKQSGDE